MRGIGPGSSIVVDEAGFGEVAQWHVGPVSLAEVALVRWPGEAQLRARLAGSQLPRLLLIEGDSAPPATDDCLEDWIRCPAAGMDVSLRCSALAARASRHVAAAPLIDGDGVVRFLGRWVALPPVEARIASELIERLGEVVSRERLRQAGWPDAAAGRNGLDVQILRLRRHLSAVELAIHTIRTRGYVLERASQTVAPSLQELSGSK